MAVAPILEQTEEGPYAGLRLSVDEYLQLPEDGNRYELINGVVFRSPSPVPIHQIVAGEISRQLNNFLIENAIGKAMHDTDVVFETSEGAGLVYQPDLVFIPHEKLPPMDRPITNVPNLVVEILSPGSRRLDTRKPS